MKTRSLIALLCVCVVPSVGRAESAFVKYRGEVDLTPFNCSDITRSSFIDRVCYDRQNENMLISLNGTFYEYCQIDADTVSSLLKAPSMGQFYNSSIKGEFDCRANRASGGPEIPRSQVIDPKILRQANALFPSISQGKERTKWIVDQLSKGDHRPDYRD
jgi:hypothetical protein